MNAKDRASFINKVGMGAQGTASDDKICSQCGAVVKGKFCSKCGTPYTAPEPGQESVEEPKAEPKTEPKTEPKAEPEIEESAEPVAKPLRKQGLPFAEVKNTIQTGLNKVGESKYCLNCGATVKGKFCVKCGTPVDGVQVQPASESTAASSGVVKKKKVQPYVAPPRRPAPTGGHKTGMFSAVQETKDEQEDSVFARGLPEWSLEPPHTPVKRKTSKLL